jgi:hypothetical protein
MGIKSRKLTGLVFALLAVVLSITACTYTTTTVAPVATVRPSGEHLPTLIPSSTPAPTVTATIQPTVPTQTPVPVSIPFGEVTPTFSEFGIVTHTPGMAEECPPVNDSIVAGFAPQTVNETDLPATLAKRIQASLNLGASLLSVQHAIASFAWNGTPANIPADAFISADLTGDRIPEIIYSGQSVSIFACKYRQYQMPVQLSLPGRVVRLQAIDLNVDGVLDLLAEAVDTSQANQQLQIYVYSWDGSAFRDLLPDPSVKIPGASQTSLINAERTGIYDRNYNETLELIYTGNVPVDPDGLKQGPWRKETHIFTWNGSVLAAEPIEYGPVTYRFQRIQDADRAVRFGLFSPAKNIYRQAIDTPGLEWWSPARAEEMKSIIAARAANLPAPLPAPVDPTEYPTLAAYAHFRILQLHAYLGQIEPAKAEYQVLQSTYPAGKPGNIYAVMGDAFWKSFKQTGSVSTACADALRQVEDNAQEAIDPIYGPWHGSQSGQATLVDLCPFR